VLEELEVLVGHDRIKTPVMDYNANKARVGVDYRW